MLAEQPFDAYRRLVYEVAMNEVLIYLKAREISAIAAELRNESAKVKAKHRGR